MPKRHRRLWVLAAAVALVVVVGTPVTVVAFAGSGHPGAPAPGAGRPAAAGTVAPGTAASASSGPTTTRAAGAAPTTARAPSVAPPAPTSSTTLPVAAAGTGGLAKALQPGQALPPVAALTAVRAVDAVVQLPATITAAETQALTHLPGLTAVEEVDIGTVTVGGAPMVALGVDPGTFREFTPQVTATQDRLWSYVAAGAVVADYDTASAHGLSAGQAVAIVPAGGKRPAATGWLGALASLGLPGVDLVIDNTYAPALGIGADNGLIVSAPGVDPYALQGELVAALHGAGVELLTTGT